MICSLLSLALWPCPKCYVWVRGSLVIECPATASGSILSLEEGGVRLSIPLDLKNCSAAGFVVLFVRCATTVVPVVQEVIVIVVERPTLPSSSVVAVLSLARGLPAPSARVVVPVSVTHYFATLQWDME